MSKSKEYKAIKNYIHNELKLHSDTGILLPVLIVCMILWNKLFPVHGPMKFLSDSQGEKSHGKNMHGKPIPSGLRVLIKFLILVLVINFKYYD